MRTVRQAAFFTQDYGKQFDWYASEAGEIIAIRFQEAVKETVARVAQAPTIGRVRKFRHPSLIGLRSIIVTGPFNKILIFYRIKEHEIEIWRMMHGARDLGRRLLEPND